MTRLHGLLDFWKPVAVLVMVVLIGYVAHANAQVPSAYEEARLALIAAKSDILRLQGALALAEQRVGECAVSRGQLEILVTKAVIDGLMADFTRQYEAAHPGLTWDFETKGPRPKPRD